MLMSAPARCLSIALLCSLLASAAGPPAARAAVPPPTDVIIVLRDGSDVPGRVRSLERRLGIRASHTYERAMSGFAAAVGAAQFRALERDPSVRYVVPDREIRVQAQEVTPGLKRVGATASELAAVDRRDLFTQRIDADIAVIDTGIQRSHPDLNVVGGHNCTNPDPTAWGDGHGHGTHVAGIAAALDNDIGVVGAAPGARLWAIKVFDYRGYGKLSWYACGVDWVAGQRDRTNPERPLFEVANMSLRTEGSDDHDCGLTNDDPLHEQICRTVSAGVTVVVAAGNDRNNASNWIPAAYDEVITVSALADFDGMPGGAGPSTCSSWGSWDADDTFANFSNYGGDVDLIAPGKCVLSTEPDGTYGVMSGTSMATPLVSGAAALWLAAHPGASPAAVRAALRAAGSPRWFRETDPDGTHERLLDISSFGAGPDFLLGLSGSRQFVGLAGRSVSYTVDIVRRDGFAGPIDFRVSGLPPRVKGSFSTSLSKGLGGLTTRLTLSVPDAHAAGTYAFTITGASNERTRSLGARFTVDDTAPTATGLYGQLEGTTLGAGTVPYVLRWRGLDAGTGLSGFELQRSTDGGSFLSIATVPAAARLSTRWLPRGHRYRYRLRAVDRAGNRSDWSTTDAVGVGLVESAPSAALTYRGEWAQVALVGASAGSVRYSSDAGARARFAFTGRAVAWVAPTGPTRGRARVYLDGTYWRTVDLYSVSSSARRLVFLHRWSVSGSHVLEIRVSATAGRPRVDVDAFALTR